MSDSHDQLPAVPEEPIPNPGLPAHTWRPTDVDPKAEKRAERQVALLFGISMVSSILFVVAYFTLSVGSQHETSQFLGLGASTLFLGLTLGIALLCIGMGIIQLARKLMGDHEIVELRHEVASSTDDRDEVLATLKLGGEESGLTRRPLVRNTMLGALGLFGIAPIILLRDLGPLPQDVNDAETGAGLEHTLWREGMHVVRDVVGTRIHVSELEVGDLVNAEPEALFPTEENGMPELSGVEIQVGKSKAAVILVRMPPEDLTPYPDRTDWAVEGIVCYSKICTHVGCPIALNERTTHHLLCPCHQSTFDLANNGKVVFGPAARALPQLPITVDADGFLMAQSDFTEPVGPSYWERDSK